MKAKVVSLILAGTLALGSIPGAGAAITPTTFHDVKPSDWYYGAVDHVVSQGYFNGVDASTFAPNSSLTRAMAVTVLARMFADDLNSYIGKTSFADVPADAYYAKAVAWASANGIASGTSATTFSPDAYATREQISVLFYNAVRVFGDLGTFDSTVLNTFQDRNRVSSWADTALQWATTKGIINGDNGYVNPQSYATRAAFATIAMNYDTKYKYDSSTPAPEPTPAPTPGPQPTPDESVAAKEDEINDLLVAAWGSNAPTRDTNQLVQAARLIASGDVTDAEQALQHTGFDKPVGTIYHDKYTYSRYTVKSFLTTTSSVAQAANYLKAQDSIQYTDGFTEYGVGVYQLNEIQFRVCVVTYNSNPYTAADLNQMSKDWLAEQATIPVTLSNTQQQIIDYTNQERARYGLAPLKPSDDMQKAAAVRAKEAAVSYSHLRPNGQFFSSVYVDIGSSLVYALPPNNEPMFSNTAGENLAGGIYTPESVVVAWMGSADHRANILNERYTHIGVALEPRIISGKQQGYYWVQCFLEVAPG